MPEAMPHGGCRDACARTEQGLIRAVPALGQSAHQLAGMQAGTQQAGRQQDLRAGAPNTRTWCQRVDDGRAAWWMALPARAEHGLSSYACGREQLAGFRQAGSGRQEVGASARTHMVRAAACAHGVGRAAWWTASPARRAGTQSMRMGHSTAQLAGIRQARLERACERANVPATAGAWWSLLSAVAASSAPPGPRNVSAGSILGMPSRGAGWRGLGPRR
jgi:hypothetical protein